MQLLQVISDTCLRPTSQPESIGTVKFDQWCSFTVVGLAGEFGQKRLEPRQKHGSIYQMDPRGEPQKAGFEEKVSRRTDMQLLFLESSELHMVRKQLSSFGRVHRPFLRSIEDQSDLRGLAVRNSQVHELVAAALYSITDGQLRVEALKVNSFNLEAGQMLINGLKLVANEWRTSSIWLLSEDDSRWEKLLRDCGFNPAAYFKQDPANPDSPKMTYWRLKQECSLERAPSLSSKFRKS